MNPIISSQIQEFRGSGFQFTANATTLIARIKTGSIIMIKKLSCLIICLLLSPTGHAAELAGVFVDDQITVENGEKLVLNGIGLREKFWVDVYVGSLYLTGKTSNIADILSSRKAWRIQMDFIYKEVDKEEFVNAWREIFQKNQSEETLAAIKDRLEEFFGFFDENLFAKDRYTYDYIPGKGTIVSKNNKVLGTIPGEDFRNALIEYFLGNYPADSDLKSGMLGLD